MSRWWGVSLGVATLLAAGLALASSPAPQPPGDDNRDVRFRMVDTFETGGYLGLMIQDVEGGTARGARVEGVKEGSPAAKAGFKKGDVILRFDGEAVRGAQQLRRLVRETPPGHSVPVEVARDGTSEKLTATVEAQKGPSPLLGWNGPEPPEPPMPLRGRVLLAPPGAPGSDIDDMMELAEKEAHHSLDPDNGRWLFWHEGGPRKLGIQYQGISGQLAKYFHLDAEAGILVTSVDEGGPAAKAGMRAGDVILKIAGKPVTEGADVRREVRGLESGKEAQITVEREGKVLDLRVTPSGEAQAPPPHEPTT